MNWFECEYPTDRSLACGWVAPNQCQGLVNILNPYRIKIAAGIEYGSTRKTFARVETVCNSDLLPVISMKMLAQKLNG